MTTLTRRRDGCERLKLDCSSGAASRLVVCGAAMSALEFHPLADIFPLVEGRRVVALTEATAAIKNPATGCVTVYRRFNKPALGPLGSSVDDLDWLV